MSVTNGSNVPLLDSNNLESLLTAVKALNSSLPSPTSTTTAPAAGAAAALPPAQTRDQFSMPFMPPFVPPPPTILYDPFQPAPLFPQAFATPPPPMTHFHSDSSLSVTNFHSAPPPVNGQTPVINFHASNPNYQSQYRPGFYRPSTSGNRHYRDNGRERYSRYDRTDVRALKSSPYPDQTRFSLAVSSKYQTDVSAQKMTALAPVKAKGPTGMAPLLPVTAKGPTGMAPLLPVKAKGPTGMAPLLPVKVIAQTDVAEIPPIKVRGQTDAAKCSQPVGASRSSPFTTGSLAPNKSTMRRIQNPDQFKPGTSSKHIDRASSLKRKRTPSPPPASSVLNGFAVSQYEHRLLLEKYKVLQSKYAALLNSRKTWFPPARLAKYSAVTRGSTCIGHPWSYTNKSTLALELVGRARKRRASKKI